MKLKRLLVLAIVLCLFAPTLVFALVVDIQGKVLTPKNEGDACIDVTGTYDGFKIEASEAGETPKICFNNSKQNTIDLHNVNIVAINPPIEAPEGFLFGAEPEPELANNAYISAERTISVEHTFPPGPNGLITVRGRIFGFFSTSMGVGVAKGCNIKVRGYFSQKSNYDPVGEGFEHTVDEEDIESAVFEEVTEFKEKYLVSGDRTLKVVLSFTLKEVGQSLTLPLGTSLTLDTGAKFQDKLESLSITPDFGGAVDEEVQ